MSRLVSQSIAFSVVLGLVAFSGCTPPPDSKSVPNPETSGTPSESAGQEGSQCADLMGSLLGQYVVPQVVQNFDTNQSMSLLNQWGRSCAPGLDDPAPETLKVWSDLVGEQTVSSLRDKVYTRRDAEHLQTCVWMNLIIQQLTSGMTDDQERIRTVFDYVVRNVTLIEDHLEQTPFSLKGILVSGQGTVSDRVWLFAELLKQLKIDVVLISAHKEMEAASVVPDLVGVLAGGETLLFEPRLGIAVPGTAEAVTPGKAYPVATLKEVIAHPELLKRLSIPAREFPLNQDSLPGADFFVYGHTGWWALRNAGVAEPFTGATQSQIFDGLSDVRERRGLLTRLKEYPDQSLSGKNYQFWSYGEQQLSSRENLNSLQQQVVSRLTELYRLPFVKHVEGGETKNSYDDPTGANPESRTPVQITWQQSGEYYRARGDQIMGEYTQSVRLMMNNQRNSRVFQEVDDRRQLQDANFSQLRQAHIRVMNDSTYWIGICKLEQKNAESRRIALDKFMQYLREYPEGSWANSARFQIGIYLASEGKNADAIQYLKQIPQADPQFSGAAWLIRELEKTTAQKTTGSEEASRPASESVPEKSTEGNKNSEEKKSEASKPEESSPPVGEANKTPQESPSTSETTTEPKSEENAAKKEPVPETSPAPETKP